MILADEGARVEAVRDEVRVRRLRHLARLQRLDAAVRDEHDAVVARPEHAARARDLVEVRGERQRRHRQARRRVGVRRGRRRLRLGRAVHLPERQPVERRLLERLLVVRAVRAHRAEILVLRLQELRADGAVEREVRREDRHQPLRQRFGRRVAVAEAGVADEDGRACLRVALRPVVCERRIAEQRVVDALADDVADLVGRDQRLARFVDLHLMIEVVDVA